jgi:hypothetical protein
MWQAPSRSPRETLAAFQVATREWQRWSNYYVAILETPQDVLAVRPDFGAWRALGHVRLAISAPGRDCVFRAGDRYCRGFRDGLIALRARALLVAAARTAEVEYPAALGAGRGVRPLPARAGRGLKPPDGQVDSARSSTPRR